MIREASSHRRRQQDFSPTPACARHASAQLMMGPAPVVGTADQPHARFESREAMSSMARATGQARQTLTHRSIEALDESGIQFASSG